LFVLAVFVAVTMLAFAGPTALAGDAKPKVVFQVFGTGAPYGASQAAALTEIGKERGWDLTVLDGKLDGITNAKHVEEAIAMNPAVIITMPIDSAACSAAYKKAFEAGIPLLNETIMCLPEDNQYMVGYTGPDDYIHGQQAAEILFDAMGGKGNVIMLTTAPGQDTTIKRQSGFEDRIKELGDGIVILQIINTDSMKEKAVSVMNDMITKYGDDINGVYAHEDYSAVGAALALKESGFDLSKVFICGVGGSRDGLQAIKDGLIYATTLQSPTRSMVQTADLVDKIIAEGIKPPMQLEPFNNFLNIPKVTSVNVDEFMPGDW